MPSPGRSGVPSPVESVHVVSGADPGILKGRGPAVNKGGGGGGGGFPTTYSGQFVMKIKGGGGGADPLDIPLDLPLGVPHHCLLTKQFSYVAALLEGSGDTYISILGCSQGV